MGRSENKQAATRQGRAGLILAVATRPLSFSISAGETAGGRSRGYETLYFDRGFNVLSARASSWELLGREIAGQKHSTNGLPAIDVGIGHNIARLMDMKSAAGVDHSRVLPELQKLVAAAMKKHPRAFAPNPGRSLAQGGSGPDLVIGTLQELKDAIDWGGMERAAEHTGSANSRRNLSHTHLGVVHDLAMVAGHESLAQACRIGRRRFVAVAA